MKHILPILFFILVGCSGDPEQHFIYDVTETGSAHLEATYFQDGTDWEGYYWSERWTEWASDEWAYSVLNGKIQWVETPGADSKKVLLPYNGIFTLDTSKLKPSIPFPKQYFTGNFVISSSRSFKLVLLESEYRISESEYRKILERKNKGMGVWINNYGYLPESEVPSKFKTKGK